MDYFELECAVEEWAQEKGIMSKASPMAQALKTLEECTELLTAINNKDCSSQALFYVESKYPLNGQKEGEPRRSKDGNSYFVKLSKMHPMDRNLKIYSSYAVVVDENCKVISSKKSNSKF